MCEYPEVIDISVDDLCNEVVNNVLNEQDYTTCTVVVTSTLAKELVHKILAIKDSFDLVTDCKIDAIGFYYVSVSSDCKLYCEPVFHDGIPFIDEASMTYIQENVPESLMKYFISDFKLIFGIEE